MDLFPAQPDYKGMNASVRFNLVAALLATCLLTLFLKRWADRTPGMRGHVLQRADITRSSQGWRRIRRLRIYLSTGSASRRLRFLIKKVETIEPEFVRVPLDRFTLPLCPANSSKTREEIDYLLRLQAQRTNAEGERALYFASWGYSSSMKRDDPEFEPQQRNLFYVGR